MKKMLTGVVIVALLTVSYAAWAAEGNAVEKKEGVKAPATPAQPRLQAAPNAQALFQDALQKRQQQQEEAVKELEDVKKIAQEEKATKTVEAIQKLIDKKNEEFKKQTEELEKRRSDMMNRMRDRQPALTPATGTKPEPVKETKPAEKK